MNQTAPKGKALPAVPPHACLSCGTELTDRRRRYCSIPCRQRLRYKLEVRTGLLKAINARYATFYFTRKMVIMDVMPYGSRDIYSFMYPRSVNQAPADDFSRMADHLGNSWWSERRRSHRKYSGS